MNNKISNYLTLGIIQSSFFIFVIILIVIFGNQLFLVFNQSLNEGLLGSELFPFILLKSVRDLPFILSLSLILGITFSLNKLYKNSEIVILTAAGVSDLQIFKIISRFVLISIAVVLCLSVVFVPIINKEINFFKQEFKTRPDYIFFKEGVFQDIQDQKITFFSSKVDTVDDKQLMGNIFLLYGEKLILAKTGEKYFNQDKSKVYLKLYDGNIYSNFQKTHSEDISISKFNQFDVLLYDNKDTQNSFNTNSDESSSIIELFNSNKVSDYAEIFYRLSIPLSLMIMIILSIQLSKTNSRKSKNYSIGYVFILYISYYNLLMIFKEFAHNSLSGLALNLFSIHLVFFILFLAIFLYRENFLSKLRYKL